MSKLCFIVNHDLKASDFEKINTNLFTLDFKEKYHLKQSASELFLKFDAIIINIGSENTRNWLSQESKIMAEAGVQKVFIGEKGTEMNIDEIKKRYGVNYCIKVIPSEKTSTKTDYINKFLSDYIPEMKISRFKKFKRYIKKKFCCATNQ